MARRKSIVRNGLEQYLMDQAKGYATIDKVKEAREKKKKQKEMEKKKRMGYQ